MFEQMIEDLKAKRAQLNQSNSFDEISLIWKEIKENYEKCDAMLEDITKQTVQLESDAGEELILNEQLRFSDALTRMNEISECIKTVSIAQMPSLIKEMQALKKFCFKKLDEEKVKMEEIK